MHSVRLMVVFFQILNLNKTFHKNTEAWNQSNYSTQKSIQSIRFINMKSLCQTQQNLMRSIDSSTHSKVSYFTETFCPEFRPWVNKTGKTFLCIIQKFDSHDMLIPTDQHSWSLLKLARKSLPVEVLKGSIPKYISRIPISTTSWAKTSKSAEYSTQIALQNTGASSSCSVQKLLTPNTKIDTYKRIVTFGFLLLSPGSD